MQRSGWYVIWDPPTWRKNSLREAVLLDKTLDLCYTACVLVPTPSNRALRAGNQAGYEPENLDAALAKHIKAVENTVFQAEGLGKQVESALANMKAALGTENALREADRVVAIFERLAKSCLYFVKCTDELTRLRSFLAGGPDSRPDLSSKCEADLVKEVLAAVKAMGWQVTIPSSGKLIPVEAP